MTIAAIGNESEEEVKSRECLYEMLVACYKSGQITEDHWQEHLQDAEFAKWLDQSAVVETCKQ